MNFDNNENIPLENTLQYRCPCTHTRGVPGVVFKLEEVVQAVDALMGPGAFAAIFTALRITGALQEMTDFYDQRMGLCFEWAE